MAANEEKEAFAQYGKKLKQDLEELAVSVETKMNILLDENLKAQTTLLAHNEIASRKMFQDGNHLDRCKELFQHLIQYGHVCNPFYGAYNGENTELIFRNFNQTMLDPQAETLDHYHPFIPFFIALRMGFQTIRIVDPDTHDGCNFIIVIGGNCQSIELFNRHYHEMSMNELFHKPIELVKDEDTAEGKILDG